MCETCIEGICSHGCLAKTQVVNVVKITPHPIPGAVGDETDRKHESVNEQFERFFPKEKAEAGA